MPTSFRLATTLPDSPRTHSVRALLTRFALVAFLVVGTSLVFGKIAVDAVIARVEADELSDALTRSQLAFGQLAGRAKQQVEDFAYWNETVRLAKHPAAPGATGFFQRNFVDWLPRNDYQFIALLDADRSTAFEWTANPQVRRPDVAMGRAFLDSLAQVGSIGGFFKQGSDLYLIGGAAVRPTTVESADTVARGYLVIGRTMRGDALTAIARGLQFDVRIHPPATPLPDTPQHAERFANDDSIRAFFRLPGAMGTTSAVIEIRDSRSDLHRISRWTFIGVFLGLLFGAAAFWVVWMYGRRLLITPLGAIASEMDAMHRRGELSLVKSAPPSEEWALFLATFNSTVLSLRDSEQRYRALFDHSADPYFLIDAATRTVVDANAAVAALTGERRETFVDKPVPETLRAQGSGGGTIRVRRADGAVQTWGVVETGLSIGDRRLTLCAYRDLTDREALAQSQKMDAIGSLAGGIAHDFNNLMGAVLAGVRVARLATAEKRSAAHDAIEHAGRRAAELTKQLLGVSAHEPLVRVPVDVGAAIANTERMCTSAFDRRIRIRVDTARCHSAVDGDPGQVEQALLNLCINARDAMPGGGTLRITARDEAVDAATALTLRDIPPGNYVLISVADDGAGMTDEVKQRAFEPFFTTKARGKGTGLGLAMVYGLVRSAGGTVFIDSAPGAGARFDLYLPASNVASSTRFVAKSKDDHESLRPPPGAERPVILLADDETALREMLRMVLEHEGFDVIEAANGEEAVQTVERERDRVAAVLLDVQMPVLGGLDAYARIHRIAPQLPVILGTGFVGEVELTALRETGADDLMTKPYDIRVLVQTLTRLTTVRV